MNKIFQAFAMPAVCGLIFSVLMTGRLIGPLNGQDAAIDRSEAGWFGTMDTKGRIFRFYVTLETFDGQQRGKLLSLDEGGGEFQLQDVMLNEDSFRFKLPATSAEYIGERSNDPAKVNGRWLQAGNEFELNFRHVSSLPEQQTKVYWTGQIDAILQKLDVAFREIDDSTVLFDSISQRIGGFVAQKSVDGSTIVFHVPMLKGTFTGELSDDKSKIIGKWKQGPASMDLTLNRSESVAEPSTGPIRPQTPNGPFPYEIEQFHVKNKAVKGVELAGTLTIPRDAKPRPAVVLISGSGPQDRDESIAGHKPFWVIADHLSRNGIAVLRFDDRGVGHSTGDFAKATSEDFASDVKSLVGFLKNHPRIDGSKISLCGHSEGGIVAPMVAVQDPDIAALVLLAAPGVTGEKVLISQSRLILEAAGTPEAEIKKQQEIQRFMIEMAKRVPRLETQQYVDEAKKAIAGMLDTEELSQEELNAIVMQSAEQLLSPWFQFFLTYDPATAFSKVDCPTLVLNGGADLQVDPNLNVVAIEQAFGQSGFQNYEVQILGGLNHLFQTVKNGTISEYAEIEETFSPKALNAISDWLLKTFQDEQK